MSNNERYTINKIKENRVYLNFINKILRKESKIKALNKAINSYKILKLGKENEETLELSKEEIKENEKGYKILIKMSEKLSKSLEKDLIKYEKIIKGDDLNEL